MVFIGDVQALVDGQWRVVLAGKDIPVTDRRRQSARTDRPPTFGPGSRPYRKPTAGEKPPSPNTRTIPGPWQTKPT